MIGKKFIFDTNILLINPSLLKQHRNQVEVCKTVFDELDYRKRDPQHQENASLAINEITLQKKRLLSASRSKVSNDEKILFEIKENLDIQTVIFVSNDTAMRHRAEQSGIQNYDLDQFLKNTTAKDTVETKERQEFYKLILDRNFEKARSLLQGNNALDVNYYLRDGNTPLIECIRSRKFEEIDFIISLPNTDLDLPDKAKLNISPFCHSAQRRQIKTMDKLINAGANPYITSRGKNRGNSALLIAAWDGALDVIRWINKHPKINFSLNQSDNNGFTPLIKAAIKGHAHIVKYLLTQKVDIHIRDRDDKTALQHAQEKQHQEVISLLKGS